MTRATLFAGTALTLLFTAGITANAAPINLINVDGASVTVAADQTVSSTNRNDPPYRVNANEVTISNAGLIENTDTRNNTNAIEVNGNNLTVTNSGTITSGDRAIHIDDSELDGPIAHGLRVINEAEGVISSRRQTIRSYWAEDVVIENHGVIESQNGRALQLRGNGVSVINHGRMSGSEEVIEARLGFTLENHGEIVLNPAIADDDGVQFSSGEAHNWGLIQGTDDGIDIDEGLIHNHAGGRIISIPATDIPAGYRDHGGIDADDLLDDPTVAPANQVQAGALYIVNEGLIQGPRAITAGENRTGAIHVKNSGQLIGTHDGIAIDLPDGIEEASLFVWGSSQITGDVIFGNGTNLMTFGDLDADAWIDGTIIGGTGTDTTVFESQYYSLADLSFSIFGTDGIQVTFGLPEGSIFSASFTGFDFWEIGGQSYTTAEIAAFAVAPVPLPAGVLLLGSGLVAFGVLRRRRA